VPVGRARGAVVRAGGSPSAGGPDVGAASVPEAWLGAAGVDVTGTRVKVVEGSEQPPKVVIASADSAAPMARQEATKRRSKGTAFSAFRIS
jgi:uncharacterized phage protein gp47/JayE